MTQEQCHVFLLRHYKDPILFRRSRNTKVSKVDITTGYPVSADVLRQQLADLLGMNIMHIAVHPEGWEQTEEKKKKKIRKHF